MINDLNITLAQINPLVGDINANAARIKAIWEDCGQTTDLLLFPECVLTGYPPEDLVLKPEFMDHVHRMIDDLISFSSHQDTAALITAPWRENGQTYNAALLITEGKIIGKTFKHFLPNYGVFDDQRIFDAGDLPAPIPFKGHKLGVMICEDAWFPDVAAHLKKLGSDILIVPNASPFTTTKYDSRMNVARARVKETGLTLIYLNQIGGQDELVFDGGSFVLNVDGNVTQQLPFFKEFTTHITDRKSTKHPDLNEKIYNALTLGLRDYVTKNGFTDVLIGMSGGIDSALSAAIAVDALGAAHVHCIMMPSEFTSQDSLEDAKDCAEHLGASYKEISIAPIMAQFESTLPDISGIAHENTQARIRGNILMAHANQTGAMLITTGNKSEMAVGYATLYGDMCGGFNALKDVYKTQVYALARWRNTQGEVIPERIITKAPSAELKPDQTDQDSLPPYDILDDILEHLIEKQTPLKDIPHPRERVFDIWRLLDRNEYKRRQAPPGTKITPKAFGKDRRVPMTNGFIKTVEKS